MNATHKEAVKSFMDVAADWDIDSAMGIYFEESTAHASEAPPPPTAAAAAPTLGSDDNVRAPLPPKIDILTTEDDIREHRRRDRAVRDTVVALRDFNEEAQDEEKRRKRTATGNDNKKLGQLFKPPFDLMMRDEGLSFDGVLTRSLGCNKWLLLNIQCADEFITHELNRDVFNDGGVYAAPSRKLIMRFFSFLQCENSSENGEILCKRYNVQRRNLPCLMIIDPMTGQRLLMMMTMGEGETTTVAGTEKLVVSKTPNWLLGIIAARGRPYDRHPIIENSQAADRQSNVVQVPTDVAMTYASPYLKIRDDAWLFVDDIPILHDVTKLLEMGTTKIKCSHDDFWYESEDDDDVDTETIVHETKRPAIEKPEPGPMTSLVIKDTKGVPHKVQLPETSTVAELYQYVSHNLFCDSFELHCQHTGPVLPSVCTCVHDHVMGRTRR